MKKYIHYHICMCMNMFMQMASIHKKHLNIDSFEDHHFSCDFISIAPSRGVKVVTFGEIAVLKP